MVSPFTSHIVPRRLSQSRPDPNTLYDIIIIGGGPAGISAARRAHFHNCKYIVFEKGVLANTIDVRYARGKHVLALPESLVLPHDHLSFNAGSKEEVLQQFADCVARHRLQIQTQTEVTGIVQHDGVFEVQTDAGAYRAASVVLAVGRGHLRELDVHDAKLPHVKYTVDNLQEYIGQHILIVGAGDSAANVALMLVEKNRVTIANRSPGFWKMNPSLKNQIEKKVRDHELTVYHNATVIGIDYGETVLAVGNEEVSVKADTVVMQMGAEPPKQLLERCGIAFRKVAGSVVPVLKQSDSPLEQYKSETVDGVYLIGSLIGGDQIKLAIHQGAAVIDHILGIFPLSPGEEQLMHKLAYIPGDSVDAKLHYLTACVPLLHAVPRPQLRDIAQQSTFHNVGAGHTISLEGTYATALYTIIEGGVELHTHATPSHAMILHQGEVFGEELFSDRPLAASATSVTASLLLAIPRRTLLEVMQRVPSLQQELERVQTLHTLRRSLCSDLALAQIHDLATKATRHTFYKDESIFTQGEPAKAFYVLIQRIFPPNPKC